MIFDWLVGETKTHHFYDFGILGRVQTTQNQYHLFLETPGHLKKVKTISGQLKKTNLETLEIEDFDHFRKDGQRKMMKACLIKSRKSWIWDQYLPENMKWKFGKFLKPRNQEINKPLNQTNKNQETNKPKTKIKTPRNLNTFYFKVRESPAPFNIPTPTPAPDPVHIRLHAPRVVVSFVLLIDGTNGLNHCINLLVIASIGHSWYQSVNHLH